MGRGRVVLGAVAALAAMPAWPGDAASGLKGFLACEPGAHRAAPFCFAGDRLTAFLDARGRAGVEYSVCVRKAHRNRECRRARTGRRGRSRITLGGSPTGWVKADWRSGGDDAGSDRLLVQPRQVFANGDSLGEGTRPYLPGALPGWRVEQSTATSRHAPEGVALLRRRSLPPVIVMSLGTNDDPHAVDAFKGAVKATVRLAGKRRCVVWPNIVRPPVGGASYAGYNAALAQIARRRRNLRIVDWARLVSRHRYWLAEDGVHVSADGYKARARAIAKQVDRC